jgi:hypothetical protein
MRSLTIAERVEAAELLKKLGLDAAAMLEVEAGMEDSL